MNTPLGMGAAEQNKIQKNNAEYHLISNINRSSSCFEFLLILSQIAGIAMMVSGGFVFCTLNEGLNWNTPYYHDDEPTKNESARINSHGLLMTVGAVFLRGEALLAFRLFRHEPQSVVLGVHVFFYLLSLLLPFGGAFSVYTHKVLAKEIHLDSAHSWMGAALLLANLLHVFAGLSVWCSTQSYKGKILPTQKVFTVGLFLCTLAQLIGGIAEFNQAVLIKCSSKCPLYEVLLMNVFPLCTIAYAIFVVLLLKNDDWKSTPSDKMK